MISHQATSAAASLAMRQIVAVKISHSSPCSASAASIVVGDALEVPIGEGDDERLLRREVAIQRADADAGAARDVLDLGVEPALGECRGRGRDDLLAIAAGVGPQWLVSDG